jgi:hypothetical protein
MRLIRSWRFKGIFPHLSTYIIPRIITSSGIKDYRDICPSALEQTLDYLHIIGLFYE